MSPVETIRRLPLAAGPIGPQHNKTLFETTGADMTDATFDRPDVAVFPPVIPLTTLLIACVLQWLAPLGWIAELEWIADLDKPLRVGIGLIIVLAGLVTTSAGRRALVKSGTNVNPSQPTTALVTDGVFGHTRNPLYVGISIALCGIALIFDLDWILLLIVPSCMFLHFAVVKREERYLEQKFGDAYRQYKARVPRYFAGN
jgi:protein-S-isoprenylcysteine O-methyltransferase Ste14